MELIDRKKAIYYISNYMREGGFMELSDFDIASLLLEVPTIESRPKGVWVGIDEYPHEEWECSNCGNIINTYLQDESEEHEYCHKCGAKMLTPWADTEGEE